MSPDSILTNPPEEVAQPVGPAPLDRRARLLRRARWLPIILGFVLLYLFYVDGLSKNPPGFYVDESAIAYNAYCIAWTGANEFGTRMPLFFPVYTGGWTQYANPTQIYLLALPFAVKRPTILLARVYAASWVFGSCLLLGLLARKISSNDTIGLLVAVIAIFTPWLFDVSRLVMETFFYPMALALFLLAVYAAQKKERWSWLNILAIAGTLTLLTYSYTIGRLLGPLLAVGLGLFITSYERLLSVLKTWPVFMLALIPLLVFRSRHPEALTQRFYLISYIKPDTPWKEIIPRFIHRYLEDLNLVSLLLDGDGNPRHHAAGTLGSFLIAAFILSLIGLLIVLIRHWHDAWWRFIIFGAAASIVPAALTNDQFHSLRLVAYPTFLLLLMVPALQFLLRSGPEPDVLTPQRTLAYLSTRSRRLILGVLLAGIVAQVFYFQAVYRREGANRGYVFDEAYQSIYDAAVAQPNRPIYLKDGTQPAYVHALWYATVQGRRREEFVHLEEGVQPPAGAIVIDSETICEFCEVIMKRGDYVLYRAL